MRRLVGERVRSALRTFEALSNECSLSVREFESQQRTRTQWQILPEQKLGQLALARRSRGGGPGERCAEGSPGGDVVSLVQLAACTGKALGKQAAFALVNAAKIDRAVHAGF